MADKVTMTEAQLCGLLERAAEAGARRALESVGLHDGEAAGDVHDLRNLLEAWREAKSAALKTAVKVGITLLITAMAAGLGLAAWTKE